MSPTPTAQLPPPATVDARAQALLECIGRLHGRGWCDGTAGNFSLTLAQDPTLLLLTRTGLDKGKATRDDLLVVGAEARALEVGPHEPSSEALIHVAIQREAGAGAILHTHSLWGTLLSERYEEERGLVVQGYEMLKGIEGVRGHWDQVFVPVIKNSQDVRTLAERVARLIARRPELRGFLIAGHGLYAWGSSLEAAHRHVEVYEFLFQAVGWKHVLDRLR